LGRTEEGRERRLTPPRDPSQVPERMSAEESRRFWDTHEITEEFLNNAGSVPDDELPSARPRTKPVGIRFDGDLLERLKILARRKHIGYQTLVKGFVAERLHVEER
jgi:CopG antitoxin of type II toxin-antitoxin system